MNLSQELKKTIIAQRKLSILNETIKSEILTILSQKIKIKEEEILNANKLDLSSIDNSSHFYDRLKLNPERLDQISESINAIAQMDSPLNVILEQKKLQNGLDVKKITVPLGVVGVIYESRPNVTIDVFALCFKSGNSCVLKGGKEAQNTNEVFVKIIKETLSTYKFDDNCILLLPSERIFTQELLHSKGLVDVIIPRGGSSLINYVRENSKVPVIETGAGVVHTYIHSSANSKKAKLIVENSKTRRPSVCNSLDCLVVDENKLEDLAEICRPLASKNVLIFADETSYKSLEDSYPNNQLMHATEEHFGQEFLSLKMSIKTVKNINEAINHITKYSSKHSEAIIAQDLEPQERFLTEIDAAAVYVNTSTAFTDGGELGLGAEIGISTQKLHARGPMGLRELTSYKWVIRGDGQVRG